MKDWKLWQVVVAVGGGLLIVSAVLVLQFSIVEMLKGIF